MGVSNDFLLNQGALCCPHSRPPSSVSPLISCWLSRLSSPLSSKDLLHPSSWQIRRWAARSRLPLIGAYWVVGPVCIFLPRCGQTGEDRGEFQLYSKFLNKFPLIRISLPVTTSGNQKGQQMRLKLDQNYGRYSSGVINWYLVQLEDAWTTKVKWWNVPLVWAFFMLPLTAYLQFALLLLDLIWHS